VGKRQVTNTENREETVRREELRVDGDEDRLRKAS
jgi:stress response protein YsnF